MQFKWFVELNAEYSADVKKDNGKNEIMATERTGLFDSQDYSITQRKIKEMIRFRTSVPSCQNVDYLNHEIDRELQKLHF